MKKALTVETEVEMIKKKKNKRELPEIRKKYLKWKFHWMGLIDEVKTVLVNINTG